MKQTVTFLILMFGNLVADSDLIQRSWSVPEMTPIIQIFDNRDEDEDPFAGKPLLTIDTFAAQDIQKWLHSSGVTFPPQSFARYEKNKMKGDELIVKNTPHNLELIDGILSSTFPIHTTRILLEELITEIEGKKPEEITSILRKYPTQVLGPVASILNELEKLDKQLTYDLDPKLKATLRNRREQVVKIFPASIKATLTHFKEMIMIIDSEAKK